MVKLFDHAAYAKIQRARINVLCEYVNNEYINREHWVF